MARVQPWNTILKKTEEIFFSFKYLKIVQIWLQSTFFRCIRAYFFIPMSKNDQSLFSEQNLQFSRTNFSSRHENMQTLALDQHFEIFEDYFFVQISENGQFLASEYHFEMFENYIFCFEYLNLASIQLQSTILICPKTIFVLTFEKGRIF